jgi:hypothetical protein
MAEDDNRAVPPRSQNVLEGEGEDHTFTRSKATAVRVLEPRRGDHYRLLILVVNVHSRLGILDVDVELHERAQRDPGALGRG